MVAAEGVLIFIMWQLCTLIEAMIIKTVSKYCIFNKVPAQFIRIVFGKVCVLGNVFLFWVENKGAILHKILSPASLAELSVISQLKKKHLAHLVDSQECISHCFESEHDAYLKNEIKNSHRICYENFQRIKP